MVLLRATGDMPETPPLVKPAPTAQAKPETDKLGTPLDLLTSCRWCWGQHPGACPYIKVAEWHPNGQVARVVLKERAQHEGLIAYPGEEESDALRRALQGITEAQSLENAQKIAAALLELLDKETESK
jgi:hypothetical protein